ncbi:phage protein [Streptococcus pneumoniae]|nr:phage protein [Streptococcus pneumoniae]
MAETNQNTDNLLDLTKITEPFDLASALRYMKENGEFIRCKNVSDDFYMYRDVQKRPVNWTDSTGEPKE